MKKVWTLLLVLCLALGLCACTVAEGEETERPAGTESGPAQTAPSEPPAGKGDDIPFEDGQLYAAAYLGYQQIEDLDYYVERYLDSADLPTYVVSDGDFYLIIPRYDGMKLSLYVNDIETDEGTLLREEAQTGPFIVQCNVSDVFEDVTIRLEHEGETVEFSPFISLKDGTPQMGERGLDITKPGTVPVETEEDGGAYVGEYTDREHEVPGLEIALNDDGTFTVQVGIVRLAQFTDGVGTLTEKGLRFTATDPNGDPIGGLVTLEGDTATVTFLDSTWDYLPDGTAFTYEKTSNTPSLWPQP